MDQIMHNTTYRLISGHCKLFNSFATLQTYMLVAHGNYVTIYNLKNNANMDHKKFHEEVRTLIRATDRGDKEIVYVVLQDNSIFRVEVKKELNK